MGEHYLDRLWTAVKLANAQAWRLVLFLDPTPSTPMKPRAWVAFGLAIAQLVLLFVAAWWRSPDMEHLDLNLLGADLDTLLKGWAIFWGSTLLVYVVTDVVILWPMVRQLTRVSREEANWNALLLEGRDITKSLEESDAAKDEQTFLVEFERAKAWERLKVPKALALNAKLKNEFDQAAVPWTQYESNFNLGRDWIPGMRRNTLRLADAIVAVTKKRSVPA